MTRLLVRITAVFCSFAVLVCAPVAVAQETETTPAVESTEVEQQQDQSGVPPLPPVPGQESSVTGNDAVDSPAAAYPANDQEQTVPPEPMDDEPVEVTDSPDTWFDVQPESAGAVFKMPSEPREVEREFTMPGGQVRKVSMFLSAFHDEQTSIVLSYHDLNEEPRNNNRAQTVLDGAVRGAVANVLGNLESHTPIRIGRHHARDFVYTAEIQEQPIKIASRVILAGKRVYSMAVVMKTENYSTDFCSGFFESFSLRAAPAGEDSSGN